nr:hypothetical protein Iba_chr04aCG18910 [Ipomoea batatas]
MGRLAACLACRHGLLVHGFKPQQTTLFTAAHRSHTLFTRKLPQLSVTAEERQRPPNLLACRRKGGTTPLLAALSIHSARRKLRRKQRTEERKLL